MKFLVAIALVLLALVSVNAEIHRFPLHKMPTMNDIYREEGLERTEEFTKYNNLKASR